MLRICSVQPWVASCGSREQERLYKGGDKEQQHLGSHDVNAQVQAGTQGPVWFIFPEYRKVSEDVQASETNETMASKANETMASETNETLASETYETLEAYH